MVSRSTVDHRSEEMPDGVVDEVCLFPVGEVAGIGDHGKTGAGDTAGAGPGHFLGGEVAVEDAVGDECVFAAENDEGGDGDLREEVPYRLIEHGLGALGDHAAIQLIGLGVLAQGEAVFEHEGRVIEGVVEVDFEIAANLSFGHGADEAHLVDGAKPALLHAGELLEAGRGDEDEFFDGEKAEVHAPHGDLGAHGMAGEDDRAEVGFPDEVADCLREKPEGDVKIAQGGASVIGQVRGDAAAVGSETLDGAGPGGGIAAEAVDEEKGRIAGAGIHAGDVQSRLHAGKPDGVQIGVIGRVDGHGGWQR